LFLAPVGGQLAALAEPDVVVHAVVVLHHVQRGLGLPLQIPVSQPAARPSALIGWTGQSESFS
jgi:hypothetical protein